MSGRDLEFERRAIASVRDAARITELESNLADAKADLAAARSAAREATRAHSDVLQLAGRLEVENARLRRDVGETSASISRWQNETFGPATTTWDRCYCSHEAMRVAMELAMNADHRVRRPNLSRAIRAAEELAELIVLLVADDADLRACPEVADVHIVLAGIPAAHGLEQADLVDVKMGENRVRKWDLTGDGHGQHVEDEP